MNSETVEEGKNSRDMQPELTAVDKSLERKLSDKVQILVYRCELLSSVKQKVYVGLLCNA